MADSHDHEHTPSTDCEQALAEIYTYLDGELTDEKRSLIAGHLQGCNPCIEVYDFEAELRVVISTRARNESVPETLRLRISEKLTMLIGSDLADTDHGPERSAEPDPDRSDSIGQPPPVEA